MIKIDTAAENLETIEFISKEEKQVLPIHLMLIYETTKKQQADINFD